MLAAAPNLGCSWPRAHGRLEVATKKMFRKENIQVDARVSRVVENNVQYSVDYRTTVLRTVGSKLVMVSKIENTSSSGTTSSIEN